MAEPGVIVVTGAAGFIGSRLVAALTAAGEAVVAIDRRPLPAGLHGPGVPLLVHRADLLRPDRAVERALGRAEVVVHLAGRAGVRDPHPDAERRWWRDNVEVGARVLSLCDPAAHLVVTSSSSVYGGADDGRPRRETDELRPRGGYARSKAALEALAADRTGPTAVLRPFTVVGEGQRPDMALSRWIAAAAAGRPIEVHGHPDRSRDLTDVADVVRVLRAVIGRRIVGTLNVGTGRAVTLGELAAAVCTEVAEVDVRVVPCTVAEPDHTLADTTRLVAAAGVRPVTDLRAVVRRQAAAQLVFPLLGAR